MKPLVPPLLAAALSLLPAAGQAQAPRAVPVSAQALEQKLAMVDRLLTQSPVSGRVQASGNEQARRHLAHARELGQHARQLQAAGVLRGADLLANEAIGELSRAQALAPDAASLQAGERARYSQLEDSIYALQRTARSLPGAAAEGERVVAAAQGHLDQAQRLARADQYAQANQHLDRALVELLAAASSRLAGRTIVYDRRFASPAEEYADALARLLSHERLVPLALLEFRPSSEAQALIERYVAQARDKRQAAEQQLHRDTPAALQLLAEGNELLRRALQAAGLQVPQTMD